MPKEQYTALRVLVPAADKFRRLARQVAAVADQDVTQTDVLDAAVTYALGHVGDVAGLVTGQAVGAAAGDSPGPGRPAVPSSEPGHAADSTREV